ncbi:BAH_G0000210.mRNA.1.CDS.1 [Saccharomyces cerevisiae]|nr:SX2_G0048800.mRNA.1.CDS.1 [Saccharomyces cerevisiae]CAI4234882.1 BAG_1a_G0000200.mRNA.1.CDS.1 [Saccharomyces cerevisiae]CAI4234931.1 BAH_G0000210.mRNA.1.CDS.1 [Saccharomyces cerevisiae]CAI7033620.1 BAG_1a_G0000200.mRNA.1.CDS.1 [Saccharomyces cerevisiae]CAI7033632.1 BAH_G0000210.mRNA.1.CDS.1 [Saccharomyces cerevisiae]
MVRRWIPSGSHLRNNDNTGDDDDSEFTNSMDSGMSIPSLRDSMTTRSSHNDPIKPALMNDSNKVKNLEKELTNAKIKIQVLYEYIRRIPNKDGNAPSLGNDTDFRNSIIEGLNLEINKLKQDLKAKEVEYQDTLQFVQENLENSESIVNTINHLLSFILTHFNEQDENAHLLDKEERETLEETLELSSDYVLEKMDTLSKFIIQFLQDFLHSKSRAESKQDKEEFLSLAQSSPAGSQFESRDSPSSEEENADGRYQNDEIHDSNNHIDTENVMANSTSLPISAVESRFEKTLDTQLEIVIENLHKEYDQFINSIRLKFEKSQKLEKIIASKLNEQSHLLDSLELEENSSSVIEKQDHLISQLKEKIESQSVLINNLEKLKEDIIKMKQNEKVLTKELETQTKINKLKENNWDSYINDLEKQINDLQIDKSEEFHVIQNQLDKLDLENYQLKNQLNTLDNQKLILSQYESNFIKFNQNLLLHLDSIFNILQKILQESSIAQFDRKMKSIKSVPNALKNLNLIQPKLESLYTFIETALESIINSYISSLIAMETPEQPHQQSDELTATPNKELTLRIEELQRRWISERERRKLDANASEARIKALEQENESLRSKLFNLSINNP